MSKLYKIVLKATIGYFYGIVLIRIFKVFILIRRRVIYSRDVRFDDTKVYYPIDLDIGAIYTRDVSEIIKLLDLLDEIVDRQRDLEEYNDTHGHGDDGLLRDSIGYTQGEEE